MGSLTLLINCLKDRRKTVLSIQLKKLDDKLFIIVKFAIVNQQVYILLIALKSITHLEITYL